MSNTRRDFIKKSTAGMAGLTIAGSASALSARSYKNVIGANDRIFVAIQGLNRRFKAYIEPIISKKSNVRLLYLCDVYKKQREQALRTVADKVKNQPKLENDIRKVLDDREVDAVFMSTPDHWHTPGALMALKAGKHVYLEKPCSHNPAESELLIRAQEKYRGLLIQMGNQQRSSNLSQQIIKEVHEGVIGNVYKAVSFYSNDRPEVPIPQKAAPPEGLDWDLFQGPSPRKPYMHDTWDYNWHWYGWDFGTAEMGNNATHELDIARWALQVKYPSSVTVEATKYHFPNDGWEMYDTMEATFRFSGGKTIVWDGKSRNGYYMYGKGRGTFLFGTEGTIFIDRGGYEHYDRSGNLIKDSRSSEVEAGTALGGGGNLSTQHAENFFAAIRGKEALTSPIDQGAISQNLTHYANIAYRTGKSFEIDEHSGIMYDKDAMSYWSREYEPGWEPKV